ncbi:MAG: HlyD family efflux transporter periplasmic adaptor subunit [Verrucomicrobiales bacterium]|nr:HlyD family efflux transporter periplasmic adaptor subunit [Verrucomicrobiales bacterium]
MPHHHPNKLQPLRPKGYSLRRYVAYWPLLVWLGAIGVAVWSYQQGAVFKRMNGAVDVYQESVSPQLEGKLESLGPGIERGKRVEAGAVVAIMRSDLIDAELAGVMAQIEADRRKRLSEFDDRIFKLESEKRGIDRDAEEVKNEAEAFEEVKADKEKEWQRRMQGIPKERQGELPTDPMIAEYNAEIAKSRAQHRALMISMTQVDNEIAVQKQKRDVLAKETDPMKYVEDDRASELMQLRASKEGLRLKATVGGIIDRIDKEPGEFVMEGEGIVKIVADPTQVIGFLAQEQVDRVEVGADVWITPLSDRTQVFHSKVLFLAPRTNFLSNSTSPAPGARLFGRDVICEYPKGSTLLPGQTVTIHLDRPGAIPLWDQFFGGRGRR